MDGLPEKKAIVIVEDNEPIAELIKDTLNSESDYQAVVVGDAARAVEAGEREHLVGNVPASLVGVQHPGQRGRNHCSGRDGPQHKTRKHAATPTHRAGVSALWPLYPLLTILTVATLEQVGW